MVNTLRALNEPRLMTRKLNLFIDKDKMEES